MRSFLISLALLLLGCGAQTYAGTIRLINNLQTTCGSQKLTAQINNIFIGPEKNIAQRTGAMVHPLPILPAKEQKWLMPAHKQRFLTFGITVPPTASTGTPYEYDAVGWLTLNGEKDTTVTLEYAQEKGKAVYAYRIDNGAPVILKDARTQEPLFASDTPCKS